jgi:hypothetical protein
MSPESYEDFKEWLDLIAKKVGRAVDRANPKNDSLKNEK